MNIEFVLLNSADLDNLSITQASSKTIFYFTNKDRYEHAQKSKDFISDFYEFYISRKDIVGLIKIRNNSIDFGELLNKDVLNYLNQTSYFEKKEIIKALNNLAKKYSGLELANKLSLFLITLKNISKKYAHEKKHESLLNTIKTLEKGRLLKEQFISASTKESRKSQACRETYLGFIRAIRSNTLTTAKVIVNGKEIRMFIKSPAGIPNMPIITKSDIKQLKKETRILTAGYNQLGIDPRTFEIYKITTRSGKHYGEIAKPDNDLTPREKTVVKELLKKELNEHLDRIYAKRETSGKILVPGIKRMKKTYKRMASKAK